MVYVLWYTSVMKNGLVLGGGGAKGCYEVGSLQAFEECNIKFDCVAGTSIGAIIGAIYTQQTIDEVVDFVYAISPGQIVKDFFEFPDNFNDVLENKEQIKTFLEHFIKEKSNDISPLVHSFEKMFDYDRFIHSNIEYACMTYNVSKMQAQPFYKEDISREQAVSIIMASASCFPAFPMMDIDGQKYIDGGYADNVPISLIKEMNADKIIVIDVHGPGRNNTINQNKISLYIEPILPLTNFLDFRTEQGIRSLRLGYLETMKYLNEFSGYVYTFNRGSWPDIYRFEQYAKMVFKNHGILFEDDFFYKAISSVLGYRPKKIINAYFEMYQFGMLLEALALCSGTDAVNLYDWKDFIKEVLQRLRTIQPIQRPISFMDAIKILKNAHKEDIVVYFYGLLKGNGYRLPITYEPLKSIFDVSYAMASLWCLLDQYVRMV